MSKFLKTCHVITRIFVYLCLISVLLLYFFKPGIMEWVQTILPAVDNGAWLALVTTLSFAAVMFAASELAYKSLQDNEFLSTLSTSVLKAAFEKFNLNDKRFSKTAKSEKELNESLRDITDRKERIMQELSWEKHNSKKLQKRTIGNKAGSLFFLLAGLAFFLYPIIYYIIMKKPLSVPVGTPLDFCTIVALILTVVIILECGNNQSLLRRLNTILAIRDRGEAYDENEAAQPAPAPGAPVYVYSAPPAPAATPAPVPGAPVPEEEPAAPAVPAVPAAAEPEPPEEVWQPETWTGVPEEEPAAEETPASSFIHLTPEEPEESADGK